MSERTLEAVAKGQPCNETIVQAIAGPETAARLGIEVGDVFEARHVVTPVDGSPSFSESVTPQEAEESLARIRGEGSDN